MKRNNALYFRIVLVIVGLISTVFTFTDNGSRAPLYYTTWSVWFAFLTSIGALWESAVRKTNKFIRLAKFCSTIMIIATFIVSAFVLPDKIWTAGFYTEGSIFKHLLLPVLAVADEILYTPRGEYKGWYPYAGVVIPLIYWIAVIVRACSFRAANGGAIPEALWNNYYPYGFTNFDNGHSLGGLCGLLAGIMVGLIAIGYLFLLIKKNKKNE